MNYSCDMNTGHFNTLLKKVRKYCVVRESTKVMLG